MDTYGDALERLRAQGFTGPDLEMLAALDAQIVDAVVELMNDARPLRYDEAGRVRYMEAGENALRNLRFPKDDAA